MCLSSGATTPPARVAAVPSAHGPHDVPAVSSQCPPRLVAGVAEEQLQWFWIHTVLIPIASCLLLLVLVVLLVRMERWVQGWAVWGSAGQPL